MTLDNVPNPYISIEDVKNNLEAGGKNMKQKDGVSEN